MAKFGKIGRWKADGMSWFRQQNRLSGTRPRAPNFALTELIAPNNSCFPTSWQHLPFRFVVRIVCIPLFIFTHVLNK